MPVHLVRRSATLAPEASSPGTARALLRDALVEAGQLRWLDAAELACTEVVTNAVLHARTPVALTVEVDPVQVRVEVRDGSPLLPLQTDYDDQATTGRGMALVAAITSEHGIQDAGPYGKTVWFSVTGDPVEQSEDELLAAWLDASWDVGEPAAVPVPYPPTVRVRLLGLPPTLWLAARQHQDALLRELVLFLAEHERAGIDVSAADRAHTAVSTAVLAAVETAQATTAAGAVPVGLPDPLPWVPARLDLELELAPDAADSFGALQDSLDAAEELAAGGSLFERPGLPEVVAVRDWACEQVIAQVVGEQPSPWPGTAQERFAAQAVGAPPVGWDPQLVSGSDLGAVAADESNRILAVSAPLARLVGSTPEELVGRRIVALVPQRLREAHVAGFSRHLSTGESRVLGVPVVLPVLTADGREVACSVLIERTAVPGGRSVYVAWVAPLDPVGPGRP